jgi:dihydrofolate synthase/folylpolyglutamate synthase
LQQLAKTYGLIGKSYPSVQEALQAAKNDASEQDAIFVGGSNFIVAEVV